MEAPSPRRLVVLGTGTEVGKTFVTVALARALRARGCSVLAMKLVETGCEVGSSGEPAPGSDAWQLEAVSTVKVPPRPHPMHALADPVSPHLAARRASTRIDVPALGSWVRRAELGIQHTTLQHVTWSIIETAGGALSPLSEESTNLDLARELEPALWLLVAPDALGVLHDLRATLSALRAAARAPELVVLSASRMPDASTGTNAAELERLGIVSPVAVLERNNAADGAAIVAERLLRGQGVKGSRGQG